MTSRSLAVVALIGCAGAPSPPTPEPSPVDEPAVEPPAPSDDEARSEPQPEPSRDETSDRAPPKPKPAQSTCAELDQNQCSVTEGCEWHSVRKCLEQQKPKTLGD